MFTSNIVIKHELIQQARSKLSLKLMLEISYCNCDNEKSFLKCSRKVIAHFFFDFIYKEIARIVI